MIPTLSESPEAVQRDENYFSFTRFYIYKHVSSIFLNIDIKHNSFF